LLLDLPEHRRLVTLHLQRRYLSKVVVFISFVPPLSLLTSILLFVLSELTDALRPPFIFDPDEHLVYAFLTDFFPLLELLLHLLVEPNFGSALRVQRHQRTLTVEGWLQCPPLRVHLAILILTLRIN